MQCHPFCLRSNRILTPRRPRSNRLASDRAFVRRKLMILRRTILLLLLLAAFTGDAQTVSLQPASGNAGTTLDVTLMGFNGDTDGVTLAFQPPGALTATNLRRQARLAVFTLSISP